MAKTKVTMTLLGFDALKKAIVQAPELVRIEAEDAVQITTFSCAQRMKAMVPVRTGRLKRAIDPRARGLSGRVLIDPAAWYWRLVEYGTVKMAARPFARPAAEIESLDYLDRIRRIGTTLEASWPTGAAA